MTLSLCIYVTMLKSRGGEGMNLAISAEWKGEGSVDSGLARKQGVLGFHTMMSIILSSFLGSVPWRIMFQFLMSRHIR